MPKKIMICFDGTSNHPKDAEQEREWFGLGRIEDSGITNILKLHAMFGGDLQNTPGAVAGQHSFYYSGVGTYGNKFQKIFNAGFAPQNQDVRNIINSAGADLKATYKKGDEIFVFGFSRGAAIARRFSSVLADYIKIAKDEQPIRFLCAFDTVASIGAPNLVDEKKPQSDVVFEDHTISPHIAEALHLLSADDRRTAFMPTLMNKDKRVTEIWFAGAHSDIGGGFWFDGLSDITLKFAIDKLSTAALGVEILNENKIDYDKLVARDESYRIDRDDIQVRPNIKGMSHEQDRFGPVAKATLTTRRIRVNIGDQPAEGEVPLVHQSMIERIEKLIDYRPKALKGILHQVVDDKGAAVKTPVQGLWDYIHQLPTAA